MGYRPTDNVTARNKILQAELDGKISAQNEYSQKTDIVYTKKGTSIARGTDKLLDHDHITPVDVIDGRYSYLSEEQRRHIASESKSNLAITSAKINRSKGALENHEYLAREYKKAKKLQREAKEIKNTSMSANDKKKVKELEKQADEIIKNINNIAKPMLKKECQARSIQTCQAQVYNVSSAITSDKNKNQIIKRLCDESVSSAVAVVKGEQQLDEAIVRVTMDTGAYGTQLVLTEVVVNDLSSVAFDLLKKNPKLLNTLKGTTNTVLQIYEAASMIITNIVDYVNDNISEEELFDSVCKGGATLILAQVIGGAVAGPLGILLGSVVCSGISILYDEFADALRGPKKQTEQYLKEVEFLTKEAKQELDNLQNYMKSTIMPMLEEEKDSIDKGIGLLVTSICECNVEQAVDGLNVMLSSYSEKVQFTTMDEFDDFFFDDDSIFDLGGNL